MDNPQDFLRSLFDAGVAAANPMLCVPPFLPSPPKGKTVVASRKRRCGGANYSEDPKGR